MIALLMDKISILPTWSSIQTTNRQYFDKKVKQAQTRKSS
jgi:hypothetical protein